MKSVFTSILLAFLVNSSFAQFTLVKDFDAATTSTFNYSSYDGFLAKLGTKVFVRYDTTNLVPVTEILLSAVDINGNREKIISVPFHDDDYGPTFYDFRELSNGNLVFVALSGSSYKIISTDGTEAGTETLYTSAEEIIGMEIITAGLFFTHKKESASNYELVKINTTTNAVSAVIDLGTISISDISKTDESTLVFLATDPADSYKLKVYKSDGTSGGTLPVKDVYSGSMVSQQTVMTKVGSKVFFFYKEPGSDCCNYLWVTDGTLSGTTKLTQFNTVFFVDYERGRNALAWNNKFYFMAVENGESAVNKALWVSDGTLSGTIALHSTDDFTNPKQLTLLNNQLYFVSYDENAFNNRLYVTDGTVAGTVKVAVEYDGSNLAPYELATDGANLYMAAYCAGHSEEVFRYNGTDLECAIAEGISGTGTGDPKNLFANGTDLFFTANLSVTGRELYTATNFTTAGSTPTSVRKESAINVAVFPNPTNTNVEVSTEKPVSQLILINAQGKEVASSTATVLILEGYPAGVYSLKVVFEDQTSVFRKLVVSE